MRAPNTIPFEKQAPELTGRACGAACLSMAYRSFGLEVPQAEIWPVIAKPNRFGNVSSTTHLMAQDALNRGFHAVAFQVRHPLQVLRLCRDAGIRAILNHRLQRDSLAGHYTIVVDIDDKSVVLHDPLFGPARTVSHAELLELWLAQTQNSEVVGAVVLVIAPAAPAASLNCEFCHTPTPLRIKCPQCAKPVDLRPSKSLGCVRDGCIARMWNWVCCPSCDFVFTLKEGASAEATAAGSKPGSPAGPAQMAGVDVAKVLAEIDKFTAHIQNIPAAANHPDVKKQLEFITAGKESFKVAHAADMARRADILGQLAAITENHKKNVEAQVKKNEEMKKPLSPLDGNALGEALLKNLGFK